MKIGILDHALDISVRVYVESLVRELELLGVRLVRFAPQDPLPEDVDLLWDPRLTGGTPPLGRLLAARQPVIATVYGAAPLGIAPWRYYSDAGSAYRGLWGMAKRIYVWHRAWTGRCAAIITISEFSKREIERKLFLRRENLIPIPLGVDLSLFKPAAGKAESSRYFLVVSQYQPKKNVRRIFASYQRLEAADRPALIAVMSRYPKPEAGPGIELLREPISDAKLVRLYQGAIALLFPSLHEGFGLPILEAMACGCPVITSTAGACPETAGGAALEVNPSSVGEISAAMKRVMEDHCLAESLRQRGLERARAMTWRRTAERHLEVFEAVLSAGQPKVHN